MEIYTFLKGRQDNKWCSLKKFDFSNRTKKVGRRECYFDLLHRVEKILSLNSFKRFYYSNQIMLSQFFLNFKLWDFNDSFNYETLIFWVCVLCLFSCLIPCLCLIWCSYFLGLWFLDFNFVFLDLGLYSYCSCSWHT